MQRIFSAINAWIERRNEGPSALLNGRIVRVVDGTGASMPDTPGNRKKWPLAGNQRTGCGFRTRRIKLCTSLLDEKEHPDEVLIALYMRRWKIELFFRDIKTTLGLDVLRCKSHAMVEKEVWMQAIAYNLVRALMLEASMTHHADVERLSFKGAVDMLHTWAVWLNNNTGRVNERLLRELLLAIASDQVRARALRSEPRVKKRRPKNYQYLTKPRHEMIVSDKRRLKK
jgi:hypothetical protein